MKAPTPKKIEELFQNWRKANYDSFLRAEECIDFAELGQQWDASQESIRDINNKETLVFNITNKLLRAEQAKGKDVEFSLNLTALNDEYSLEETNAFKAILNEITLNESNRRVFQHGLDKVYAYGQAVLLADVGYENSKSLNKIPVIKSLENPSDAFFDCNALLPTKVDGRYCGYKKRISKKELIQLHPELKKAQWLKDRNDVYDCWYRVPKKYVFRKLVDGTFKREDLITDDDDKAKGVKDKVERIRWVDEIYFTRVCNKKVLIKPRLYPTRNLPMVYHYGCTVWTTSGHQSLPFIYHLIGAQQLHNYIGSQTATIIKNSTGVKWLLTPGMIQSERAREYAEEINQTEGAIVLDDDPNGRLPEKISADELPVSLGEFFNIYKQEISDIAGAFSTGDGAEAKAISGVALDKLFNRIDILQNNTIQAHIHVIDTVCQLVQDMIPHLYTEERKIIATMADGEAKTIVINQKTLTGKIINNVKDIDNEFVYSISAGPSTALQRQNTVESLKELYAVNPAAAQLTAHIFVRNLGMADSDELSRLLSANIDPMLIKYSQGEITKDQLQTYQHMMAVQNGQAQAQQQDQLQSAQINALQSQAQSHQMRAQADQFDAQTKRMEAIEDANLKREKLVQDYQTKLMDTHNDLSDQQLQLALANIRHQEKIIELLSKPMQGDHAVY